MRRWPVRGQRPAAVMPVRAGCGCRLGCWRSRPRRYSRRRVQLVSDHASTVDVAGGCDASRGSADRCGMAARAVSSRVGARLQRRPDSPRVPLGSWLPPVAAVAAGPGGDRSAAGHGRTWWPQRPPVTPGHARRADSTVRARHCARGCLSSRLSQVPPTHAALPPTETVRCGRCRRRPRRCSPTVLVQALPRPRGRRRVKSDFALPSVHVGAEGLAASALSTLPPTSAGRGGRGRCYLPTCGLPRHPGCLGAQ